MPLHLIHGPASSKKQQHLIQLITSEFHQNKSVTVITASETHAKWLRTLIFQNSSVPGFSSDSIISWSLFLKNIVAFKHLKKHLWPPHTRQQVLGIMALKNMSHFFSNQEDRFFEQILEIDLLFQKIKESGTELHSWKDHQGQPLFSKELIDLFQLYQEQLHLQNALDQGDLSLLALKKLKKDHSKLSEAHLIFCHHYPITIGQRELIRQLAAQSKIKITLFYDESYEQNDLQLEKIFLDLGEIAHTTESFEAESKTFSVATHISAQAEINFIGEQIKTLIQQQTASHQIAVVAPNQHFAEQISQFFEFNHLPWISFFSPSYKDLNLDHLCLETVQTQLEQVQANEQSYYSRQKITALKSLQDLLFDVQYTNHKQENDLEQLPQERFNHFLRRLVNHQKNASAALDEQIVIAPLKQALAYSNRILFIPQFSLETFLSGGEAQTLSKSLKHHNELFELTEPAKFKTQVQIATIETLLNQNTNLVLSRSLKDLQGKHATELTLNPHKFSHQKIISDENPCSISIKQDYLSSHKTHYSVSEIQSYLDCPYRYYAQKILKLDEKEKDDLEPQANSKGSFVHKVLQTLFEKQGPLYIDALEYDHYRKKLFESLDAVIGQTLEQMEEFKNHPAILSKVYAERVKATIESIVLKESQFFKEKVKVTLPYKVEIPFSSETKQDFIFKTDLGEISITGRIDRLDVCHSDKTYTVIDYKTGNLDFNITKILKDCAQSMTNKDSHFPLQLPLYLMAVQKNILPNYNPSAALYYGLKTNDIKGFAIKNTVDEKLVEKKSIEQDEWQDLQEFVMAKINLAHKGIQQGLFAPDPVNQNMCNSCDFNRICEYNLSNNENENNETN